MKRPPLNARAGVSSRARSVNVALSLHLHPNFVYASSEGCDEPAHLMQAHLSLCFSTMGKGQNEIYAWFLFHTNKI